MVASFGGGLYVGNGLETRFWEDCWVGDRPLGLKLPRLAALYEDRRCMVAQRWADNGRRWQWQRPVVASRSFDNFQELVQLLGSVRCSDRNDGWSWDIGPDGVFSVAETRRWIDDLVLPSGDGPTHWCNGVPCKVNIFVWRLRLNKLPIRYNLSIRGLEIPSIMCSVCGCDSEKVAHLFWNCEVVVCIWDAVFK